MISVRSFSIALIAAVPAISALAQVGQVPEQKTEARTDGLLGPVKTVSTQVEMSGVKFQQPGGPVILLMVACRDCTYDRDGMRTRQGQTDADGEFLGEVITVVRDGNGAAVERTFTSSLTGEAYRVEQLGPFGPTEMALNQEGKLLCAQKITYDRAGHQTEWITLDPDGSEKGRVESRYADDGTRTYQSGWDDGQLNWRDTYDPETDFQRFEVFGPSGAETLEFTFSHDKVQTFWAATDEPNQYGDTISSEEVDGKTNRFHCVKGGECDAAIIHHVYADATKRDLKSAEWRDSNGTLQYAAYYEYEFDAQKNWTHRKVWVVTPELPDKTLYETDSRTITYWPK
jgi:hypothetical protein